MPVVIQSLFITPAIAVARLGGSTTPLHAYDWVDAQEPRFDGETQCAPSWTLAVQPDGSVAPFLPTAITFRDGGLIRPVAPFFEIWARLGETGSAPENWTEQPLTAELLATHGLSLSALSLTVIARNLKAARRSTDPDHAFGNWQPIVVRGNDHVVRTIEGTSPPSATVPMIPAGRHIPLGTVQVLRGAPQPLDQPWSDVVRIDTIRFRYTPAKGMFYGPPEAGTAQPALGRPERAVPVANSFLEPSAGWRGASNSGLIAPPDTYDLIDQTDETTGPSLGVVDDTCEVHFNVALDVAPNVRFTASAMAFVAPPDFAPDRRPFLSVADELNDRDGRAAARNAGLTGSALVDWVEDLFERIYETVSLFNVDHYREERAAPIPPNQLRADDLDQGARSNPTSAMGGSDALRSPGFRLGAASEDNPLPLSEHARMRHRALSDIQNLIALVALDATTGRNRIRDIVRAPFEMEVFEDPNRSSMRMPPFMRQSNALSLTLSSWQYDLLMRWVDETRQRVLDGPQATAMPLADTLGGVEGHFALRAKVALSGLSPAAAARRDAVLARINAGERQ